MPSAPLPSPAAAPPARPAPATVASPQAPAAPAPFVLWTRAFAVGALVGLIVLGLAWELWLAPTGHRTLVGKVLPLLLPLVGLLKHRLYTYRWVSLMVWLYFAEGAIRANGPERGWTPWLAWAEMLLCTVLFIACAAQVRWRLKHPADHAGVQAAPQAPQAHPAAPLS